MVELWGGCNPALLRAESLLGPVPPISPSGRVPGVTGRAQVLAGRLAVSRCPGGCDFLAVRRHAANGGARRGGQGASHRGRRLQKQALVPNCGRQVLPAPPVQPCCTPQHPPRHCHASPHEQLLTHLEPARSSMHNPCCLREPSTAAVNAAVVVDGTYSFGMLPVRCPGDPGVCLPQHELGIRS